MLGKLSKNFSNSQTPKSRNVEKISHHAKMLKLKANFKKVKLFPGKNAIFIDRSFDDLIFLAPTKFLFKNLYKLFSEALFIQGFFNIRTTKIDSSYN